jgi:hypothetical protein
VKAGTQGTDTLRGKQKRNASGKERASAVAISPPEDALPLAAPAGAAPAKGNGKGGSWVHVPS